MFFTYEPYTDDESDNGASEYITPVMFVIEDSTQTREDRQRTEYDVNDGSR